MLVMVRCVIFGGQRAGSVGDGPRRITHVHEGRVLGAWRAVDGRIGFALLDVASMAMISALLSEAFHDARHIDIEEVLAVTDVADSVRHERPSPSSKQRQTGS